MIIAISGVVILTGIHSTLSIGKNESYKIMKNNIVSASYDYVNECNQGLIACDFSFEEHNQFTASVLKTGGYFTDFTSPLDGKDLGDCLVLEATEDNGVVSIQLIDQCY